MKKMITMEAMMKRSFGFRRLALPGVLAVGVFCALPSAPGCPSPPPIVTIEATDAWADEVGPDTGTFTVTRTGDTSSALTVYYRTAGTATPGSDYQSLDGWVQIQQGNTSADITLTPIADADCDEGAETATVALISNANYEVGTPYYATVTIVDFNSWDLVANCANALTGIDTAVDITLSGSIPAACGDLEFEVTYGPFHGGLGTITPVDATHATVTYTPTSAFVGKDVFGFKVSNHSVSSASATVTVYVVPPPRLGAACGPDRIFLHWEIDPEAGEENWENWVTDFLIKRKSPGGEYQVIYTANKTSRSYTDTTVSAGVTYCYKVAIRYQDSCPEGADYEVPSNEICISTCAWPPGEEPSISGWLFTDEGFIAGGQEGAFRAYNDPASVTASPWSFPPSSTTISLRMDYEDDKICMDYNDNIQTATVEAVATVGSSSQARLTIDWSGMIEQHDSGYEPMWLYVDDQQIGYAESTKDQQGCDPMAPVSGSANVVLNPGFHLLKIITSTGADGEYQNDAYYRFDITLEQN